MGEADGPLVVKLGGGVLDAGDAVWSWLVSEHERRLGAGRGGVVVVHGGGARVDGHLAELGLRAEKRDGVRVTPREQIDAVVRVLAGEVSTWVVASLVRASGGRARVLGLTLGDACLAVPEPMAGYGMVAGAGAGDREAAARLLGGGFLLAVASIAIDAGGGIWNVNADHAAVAVALTCGASELVLASDVSGVLDATGGVIGAMDGALVESLIGAGVIGGGMIPKVQAALLASERLGIPVRITSWHGLESGTRITPGAGACAGGGL